ncbi:MAG: type II toxin-antitoxin system VapC family toxin [Lentisphaerae bacterium]|nr:type II toxin-antitoxin system VapC family toxin [Lentisphaerota bacterium]
MSEEKKIRLYLDTSVPSAYYDTSKPVRQLVTQKWFENEALSYELYISVVTAEEIGKIRNEEKKRSVSELTVKFGMEILEFSEKAEELANEYMSRGAIPLSEPQDAYHIAIATVNELDALASWNFRHIVSINPIRKIHEINRKNNYTAIEIGSPAIFGGAKYGNI